MLDYRYHYAVMAAEDRQRPTKHEVMTNRGTRRVFRLGGRTDGRQEGRR